jgi:ABC-type oligopeptide transport system ATPase subunit
MVRYISDRVAVMHQGALVEIEPVEKLYTKPQHPYTQLLFSSALHAHAMCSSHDLSKK